MSTGLDDYSFCIYLSIYENPSKNVQKDKSMETLILELRQRKQELLKQMGIGR